LSADFAAHRFLRKCEPRNRNGDDEQRPERKDRIIGKRCTALCLDQFAAVSLRRDDHTAMAPDELWPAPKTRERAITSVHRVLAWKGGRDRGQPRRRGIRRNCRRAGYAPTTSNSLLAASRWWPVPAGRTTTSPALRWSFLPRSPPKRTLAWPRATPSTS